MHDFQTKGCSSYGARMGRLSDLPDNATGELTLSRVPIDEGGYDPGGAYWGIGAPLFCIEDAEGRTHYTRSKGDGTEVKARFPLATWAPAGPSEEDIADMTEGYITAALWSSNDESTEDGGEPFDANYTANDLAPEAKARMAADCKAFVLANAATFASAMAARPVCGWSQAGHDFWLTRNGHGCGFWDGDWPKAEGETLSEAARKAGSVDLYLGDDKKIYLT